MVDINALINERLMNKYAKPANNNQGGFGGLLNFVQSPRGMDMATGLLAQSGYSPTPTNLGSAFGKANQYASGMELKRNANDLAELQALGTIYKNTKAPKKSDFFQQLDMFNEISAIPVDKRSADQNRTLEVLNDKLKDDQSVGDLKVYLANKYKTEGKLTEDNDIALEAFLLNLDMFDKMFRGDVASTIGIQNKNNKDSKEKEISKKIPKGSQEFVNPQGVTIYLVNGKYLNADGTEYKQ